MLRHLPDQQFDELIPQCQKLLSDNLPAGAYEEHVLRVVVQAELKPITELQDPAQLAQASKEIFDCYRWLYEKTNTIHRDISVSNLMFHEIEGKAYVVLNDFDLALRLSDTTPSTSKQRAGTKPYMAVDLLVLKPPYNLYRHDLESFLYVLVFLTCQVKGSPLADWKNLGMVELNTQKNAVLFNNEGFPSTKDHFQNFGLWIIGISDLFTTGFFNRRLHNNEVAIAKITRGNSPPPFDDETLGGSVTFDAFAAILNPPVIPS
ncbi:hypothetical protein DFH09DRAFT_1353610 [Mycena vulgaris]|nr:hypothetical protein DFH09DRAFT_1353610 [Mycena vulgaris]